MPCIICLFVFRVVFSILGLILLTATVYDLWVYQPVIFKLKHSLDSQPKSDSDAIVRQNLTVDEYTPLLNNKASDKVTEADIKQGIGNLLLTDRKCLLPQ